MNHKAKHFTRPAVDFPFGEILLAPLESFPVIPKQMKETNQPPGLVEPVPSLLVYFVGIVARA